MSKKLVLRVPILGLAYYIISGERKDAIKGVPFETRQKRTLDQIANTGIFMLALGIYSSIGLYSDEWNPLKQLPAAKERYISNNSDTYYNSKSLDNSVNTNNIPQSNP